jgi:excisionase family DNA binding protein
MTPTMRNLHEETILPPAGSVADLKALLDEVEVRSVLLGGDGSQIELPAEVFSVLKQVVEAMSQGLAISIVPHHLTLTTQEAAELLGISRPTFVKLLENGEIAYEKPGRHRRVKLKDVLAYRGERRKDRSDRLSDLVQTSEDSDLYNKANNFENGGR